MGALEALCLSGVSWSHTRAATGLDSYSSQPLFSPNRLTVAEENFRKRQLSLALEPAGHRLPV